MTRALIVATLALLCGNATADTLTLSPAVVPLGGRPGQSTRQQLTLFNGTSRVMTFALVARDVIVKDGARAFVHPGDVPHSIAATAVFSQPMVTVPPGEDRSVGVTLTLPLHATHRAVVILFQAAAPVRGNTTVSIGSLMTFELSRQTSIAVEPLQVTPATASTNAAFALATVNDGSEPTIVRGVIAVMNARGTIVTKIPFESRRLLPTERTVLRADYPGELATGSYRAIATLVASQRSWTRTATLEVP